MIRKAHPWIKIKIAYAPGVTYYDRKDSPNVPTYATTLSSGFDLAAHVDAETQTTLQPGRRMLVKTGIFIEIPVGYELQVRPKSGLAIKHGITVLNSPGTVDADYRGEIGVILFNSGDNPFDITPGLKIAQAVICPVMQADFVHVSASDLCQTDRGDGGYGSTGSSYQ